MKKLGILLVGILLVGLVAGCIGEKESTSTTSTTTQTPTHLTQATSTTHSETSETMTSSTTTTSTKTMTPTETQSTTPTQTQVKPKIYTREELLENLEKIKSFTYLENTSVTFDVKIEQGNTTVNAGEVSIISKKVGYIDLEAYEADINTTMTTFPGGGSSFTRQIIKNGEVYLYANGMWQKLTNETLGVPPEKLLNLTWKYNLVSLVKLYLQKEPRNATIVNGSQIFYYNISDEDLKCIIEAFLGTAENENMTISFSNGIMEVVFKNGQLYGGRLMYNMEIRIKAQDLEGKPMEIIEIGKEYDEFVIKEVNVRKKVEAPKGEVRA
ncbi:hypothetical protein [Thermococcus sp. LS2]|uniref:hypothetical protein n=1 Tax=Thermococcus sp. LS2 TaxID=1638260 RepID=UPI00143946FD|nr:hypothetical protein [Thermococcus sp. LS2]NJE11838.1 hypothetical protein [Thermococcus sp. LS2]